MFEIPGVDCIIYVSIGKLAEQQGDPDNHMICYGNLKSPHLEHCCDWVSDGFASAFSCK